MSSKKNKSTKYENLKGETDPKIDAEARDILLTARVQLFFKQPFWGNLATRMKLVNADKWCGTAATDGNTLYYNSKFIMKLSPGEVGFLLGHEISHVVYDHIDRRGSRDAQLWNIACDYAINADLKKHNVGTFITSVPCLYDVKFEGKGADEIYDILYGKAQKLNLDDLLDSLLDEHIDITDEGGGEGDPGENYTSVSKEQRESMREEFRQAVIAAAMQTTPGSLPAGIERMIKDLTEPKMPWRNLLRSSVTSAHSADYTWMKPSRRGWHLDAILPGVAPGDEVDVCVAIDTSGSISMDDLNIFMSEIKGITDSFDNFKVRIMSFDTKAYNLQEYSSNGETDVTQYEAKGGGGTDFSSVYTLLKEEDIVPKRLIFFTDLYTHDFGDPNYCPTLFISYGNPGAVAPYGVTAEYEK